MQLDGKDAEVVLSLEAHAQHCMQTRFRTHPRGVPCCWRAVLANFSTKVGIVPTPSDYKNDSRKSGEANVNVPVPAGFLDLATVHRPLHAFRVFDDATNFTGSRFRLSAEQVKHYEDHGFVSNVPVRVEVGILALSRALHDLCRRSSHLMSVTLF